MIRVAPNSFETLVPDPVLLTVELFVQPGFNVVKVPGMPGDAPRLTLAAWNGSAFGLCWRVSPSDLKSGEGFADALLVCR